MQEEKDEQEQENSELKTYELGFLIVPSISEDKLPEAVSKIKSVIEEKGGLFITEEYPKLQPLSYDMAKKIDVKKTVYKQAYFGWMKFDLDSQKIDSVKKSLDENQDILRFLLINTIRESTLASHRVFLKKEKVLHKRPTTEVVGEPSSQEEIDKSIDELVSAGSETKKEE